MTVGIIMGSKSDWPTMEHAALMLEKFGIAYETKVVSAHRTPQLLADYASSESVSSTKCCDSSFATTARVLAARS